MVLLSSSRDMFMFYLFTDSFAHAGFSLRGGAFDPSSPSSGGLYIPSPTPSSESASGAGRDLLYIAHSHRTEPVTNPGHEV